MNATVCLQVNEMKKPLVALIADVRSLTRVPTFVFTKVARELKSSIALDAIIWQRPTSVFPAITFPAVHGVVVEAANSITTLARPWLTVPWHLDIDATADVLLELRMSLELLEATPAFVRRGTLAQTSAGIARLAA
jgi:hypothetical protein